LSATPSVTVEVEFDAVVKVKPEPLMQVLRFVVVPVSVRAVAVPPDVTLPHTGELSVPLATVNVAVSVPLAESTSLKLIPVSALATSSVTPIEDGAEIAGASLTAVTDTLALVPDVTLLLNVSRRASVIVRVVVTGLLDVLLNVTPCN